MSKKIIRLTEGKLQEIVREAVKAVIKENYDEPYGRSRSATRMPSKEAKAMFDYDSNFAVSNLIGTDKYEPAPLGNVPNNEEEFPEDDQPYQYWNSLQDYENRHPIDPSIEDKEWQNKRSWD